MGGSTVKNIGRGALAGVTGGLSEIPRKDPFGGGVVGRGLSAGLTGGLTEFGQKNPFGVPIDNPLSLFGTKSDGGRYIPGPFELDQTQFDADRGAINAEGQQQYADTMAGIDANAAAQQAYAGQTIQRELPNIYEDLNSRHLLNSSALPTEIARQATSSAQDIASQVAQQKQAALTGKQGFQTGALQRGLSLEDFVNQANVSKAIGAQFAPQQPNGKQNFGTVAQGVGALAPMAKLAMK